MHTPVRVHSRPGLTGYSAHCSAHVGARLQSLARKALSLDIQASAPKQGARSALLARYAPWALLNPSFAQQGDMETRPAKPIVNAQERVPGVGGVPKAQPTSPTSAVCTIYSTPRRMIPRPQIE